MIDLHTHSRFSDGTQTPLELVTEAKAAGLHTLGLTDHDTVAGWPDAVRAATQVGIQLVRGMEVSCRYQGVSVHILCYLHNPEGAQITEATARIRDLRLSRTRRIVDLLAADFPITWADVTAHVDPTTTVGRPHVADALVTLGIVRTRGEAFETLLHRDSPYYVPMPVMSPVDAISMIHEAGGVAVFAHPGAVQRGRVVTDAGMKDIIAAGLDGIEVHHRDNPLAARAQLTRFAEDHGLIITGSSDYHGAGKPNRLGEHTTEPDMLARLVDASSGVPVIG